MVLNDIEHSGKQTFSAYSILFQAKTGGTGHYSVIVAQNDREKKMMNFLVCIIKVCFCPELAEIAFFCAHSFAFTWFENFHFYKF